MFDAGGGFGMPEMQGAGDFVMVADPATFHVLPWAQNTGWLLCDMLFHQWQAGAVLDAPALSRCAGASLPTAGFDFLAGLEVEFHLFKIEESAACAGRCHLAAASRPR